MKRRMKIGIMGVVFSFALMTALGAAFADDDLTADLDGGSGLALDFGYAPIDSSIVKDLKVTNQTDQEMKLMMTMSYNTCCVYSINCPSISYLGGGQTMIVQMTYEASGLGLCEGSLYIMYSGSSSGTVVVGLKGEGVEIPETPVEQEDMVDDDTDTVDPDTHCGDRFLWGKICQCRKEARSRGQFARCVSRQVHEMRKESLRSRHDKGILQRSGAHLNSR